MFYAHLLLFILGTIAPQCNGMEMDAEDYLNNLLASSQALMDHEQLATTAQLQQSVDALACKLILTLYVEPIVCSSCSEIITMDSDDFNKLTKHKHSKKSAFSPLCSHRLTDINIQHNIQEKIMQHSNTHNEPISSNQIEKIASIKMDGIKFSIICPLPNCSAYCNASSGFIALKQVFKYHLSKKHPEISNTDKTKYLEQLAFYTIVVDHNMNNFNARKIQRWLLRSKVSI